MNLDLVPIEDRARALALADDLQRYAEEGMSEFRDDPLPEETGRRLVERCFGQPEFLLLQAEDADGRAWATLCTAPFEDPLTAERVPMIVVLHVDSGVRHRGVARALVQEAGRILAARGAHALAARAGHNDDALISMGERWGFVRVWEVMVHE